MASDPDDARPELCIGDRERELTIGRLGSAFAEGRLDLEEYDQRIATAYAAKSAGDLLPLTTDLPLDRVAPSTPTPDRRAAPKAAPARPPWAGRSHGAAATGHGSAQGTRDWLRYTWLSWAGAVSICVAIWFISGVIGDGGFDSFWPIWVAGPWGVLLLFRTFGVKLSQPER